MSVIATQPVGRAKTQRAMLPRITRLIISYGVLGLFTVIVSLPTIWMVITSLKKREEYISLPVHILPEVPQWVNYQMVFIIVDYLRFGLNSLIVTLSYTVLVIITSAMGGFAFARLVAPGKQKLFSIILALLILPGIVTIIPNFVMMARLQLTNTYWPWILWGLGASPFYIFLFRQFFAAIPKDLEDAAEVDGCGLWRIFWQIFIPNSKPIIATAFIFNFVGQWGDYLTQLMFLNDSNTTLAVKLTTAYVTPQGQPLIPITLAACVIFCVPSLVMFFFGQKYIMRGVITSGLKG